MKKKVKDCTIEELEQWYRKETGYTVPKMKILWYEVCFYNDEGNIQFVLLKEEEITV